MATRLTELTEATVIGPDDFFYGVVGGNSRRVRFSGANELNLIINGQGRINQRNYVSGTPTTIANQYTLDRWRVVVSGQNLQFTGDDSRRVMTAPAGGVEQVIEGNEILGGTYAINWFGNAACSINGVAREKGQAFTLIGNTNATVRFSGGTFSDVMLSRGPVVPPFTRLLRQHELANCCRYYWRPLSQHNLAGTATAGGQAIYLRYHFPVPMRITPAAVVGWGSGINANEGSTRFPDATCLESFISSVGAGVFSGVYTINVLDAEF